MPWKFVCDLWFHELLQTTIVRQIAKGNEWIENSQSFTCAFECVIIFTNPSARAEYDTRSIFKRSLTEFSFS